jgi:hypothetical protein
MNKNLCFISNFSILLTLFLKVFLYLNNLKYLLKKIKFIKIKLICFANYLKIRIYSIE